MTKPFSTDVIIIGAGLSGLTSASILTQQGRTVTVLESRSRIGGRILTSGYSENKPIELGATWLGRKHTNVLELLESLDLEIFQQEIGGKAFYEPISTSPPYIVTVPESDDPSYRIRGGSYRIIEKLIEIIGEENIRTSEKVTSISEHDDRIEISTQNRSFSAQKVISTIPPNLLANTVTINPPLPQSVIDISKSTHTWMDNSIKVALTYAAPFWNEPNLSGTIASNVGPIQEMYDHSNYEKSFFALMGFFNSSYHSLSKAERLERTLSQLEKYYAAKAKDYISYQEYVWHEDDNTFFPYTTDVMPHQNNGHAIFQTLQMEDRLILSGTETSPVYSGYMDGAIYSGKIAAAKATAQKIT